ncbi:MAG: D-amino acid aminotransferase [SAR86 cluster bacterium]|uniref:Aminodeoxychorismate lyase n=1 Tax=SAR86 cluster bacterium TaxID=2030880 RepID=A0A2A5ADR2_9GAMM|nr:MAG: D-amino acid aminotransferase [SAR86 cluster bacterium]
MSRIVYVNGEYPQEEDAKISIFDRGFIFGDGVYEVVPVINHQLVDKEYFLERLDRSLSELSIVWPCSKQDYLNVMQQLVARNNLSEGIVYSQVTRGVADRDFPFPVDTPSTFVAFTSPMQLLENPASATGISVVTTEDLRWKRRDIKSINLLAQCLAKQDAVSRGAKEGWMVEDGFVTEGVSSTAYIVKNGKVITRPLSNLILPGIRRRTLLEIAAQQGIDVEERLFTVDEALDADEAFISSATTIALSVVTIDGQTIGNGKPGKVTMELRELYKKRLIDEAATS